MEEKSIYSEYMDSLYKRTRLEVFAMLKFFTNSRMCLCMDDYIIAEVPFIADLLEDRINIKAEVEYSDLINRHINKFDTVRIFDDSRNLFYSNKGYRVKVDENELVNISLDLCC